MLRPYGCVALQRPIAALTTVCKMPCHTQEAEHLPVVLNLFVQVLFVDVHRSLLLAIALRFSPHRHLALSRRPLQIERQQPRQDLVVAQVVRPAVGLEYRRVEPLVRLVEPVGALVVEVRQRALFEFSFG